jgi:hypothetical protein
MSKCAREHVGMEKRRHNSNFEKRLILPSSNKSSNNSQTREIISHQTRHREYSRTRLESGYFECVICCSGVGFGCVVKCGGGLIGMLRWLLSFSSNLFVYLLPPPINESKLIAFLAKCAKPGMPFPVNNPTARPKPQRRIYSSEFSPAILYMSS